MTVYVDNECIVWEGREWCHLVADTLPELHDFAQRLGLRRAWFQERASYPHYDVTTAVRARALEMGALRADRVQLMSCCRNLKAELIAMRSNWSTIEQLPLLGEHMDAASNSPDLTLTTYSERAQKSQRFGSGSEALQNLSFGYFGEVGGLLAALKKASRDKLLETERDFAAEELGDALWYLLAVAHAHGIKPATLGEVALELLRSHYQEHSKAVDGEVSFKNIDALIQAQVQRREDRSQLLSDLAAAAGELAAATGPQTDIRNSTTTTKFLGNHLALLSRVAASFRLTLEEIAAENLAKIADRWPGDDPEYIDPFDPDEDYPEYEQLPRNFVVAFDERVNGDRKHVVQSIRGVFVGDRLTDNSVEEDGYRFHDVFHLAYVAHLGWSPVIRGLLKRKRKSKPDVDENQDGARAMIIEEGIATWIFNHAKARGDNFAGVERGQIAFGLLKQIRQMVRGYEVDECPLWQWEFAILDGFKVFRELYEAKRGRVHVDMKAHTLVFEPMDTSQ